jgi:hypothetical protein
MGQCYSIEIKARFRDEDGAKKALQAKLDRHEEEHVAYNLPHFTEELGMSTDNLHDLMGIFFGGWKGKLEPSTTDDWEYADFDASYGWESLMMDAFETIAPYLADGSEIKIWPDSGCDHGTVRNGKCKWA